MVQVCQLVDHYCLGCEQCILFIGEVSLIAGAPSDSTRLITHRNESFMGWLLQFHVVLWPLERNRDRINNLLICMPFLPTDS